MLISDQETAGISLEPPFSWCKLCKILLLPRREDHTPLTSHGTYSGNIYSIINSLQYIFTTIT